MFDFMIRLSQAALPIFIFCTMANVGMTQEPKRIVRYWREWPFYLKMLVANFIAAPAAMWLLLKVWPLPVEYMAGLAVFSLCAGAPFLIKLTAVSEHDLALGAATMMLLVLATIVVVPAALPLLVPALSVDGGAMAWTLARQLLLPMIIGALVASLLPDLNRRLQPWVAWIANIALNVVLVATIVGYLPEMPAIIRSGALILGLLFVLAAFGLGYLAGWGNDALEDIGGLATAQRNTAAAMLIAVSSFTDPTVFVLITLVNTIGIGLLIAIAKLLKGDNAKTAQIWLPPR
jgi:bile acid:Na+ symporter, BASS family